MRLSFLRAPLYLPEAIPSTKSSTPERFRGEFSFILSLFEMTHKIFVCCGQLLFKYSPLRPAFARTIFVSSIMHDVSNFRNAMSGGEDGWNLVTPDVRWFNAFPNRHTFANNKISSVDDKTRTKRASLRLDVIEIDCKRALKTKIFLFLSLCTHHWGYENVIVRWPISVIHLNGTFTSSAWHFAYIFLPVVQYRPIWIVFRRRRWKLCDFGRKEWNDECKTEWQMLQ